MMKMSRARGTLLKLSSQRLASQRGMWMYRHHIIHEILVQVEGPPVHVTRFPASAWSCTQLSMHMTVEEA